MLSIDDVGTMLVIERSFSVGGVLGGRAANVVVTDEISTVGATDVLVTDEISTVGATDVLEVDALYEGGSPIALTTVAQHQVVAFDDLGIPIDNIAGMTFGPTLTDGRQTLVIVSDNNFGPRRFTQFIVLAEDIRPAS